VRDQVAGLVDDGRVHGLAQAGPRGGEDQGVDAAGLQIEEGQVDRGGQPRSGEAFGDFPVPGQGLAVEQERVQAQFRVEPFGDVRVQAARVLKDRAQGEIDEEHGLSGAREIWEGGETGRCARPGWPGR